MRLNCALARARSANANVPSESYELPDGRVVELAAERFEIAERMFVDAAGDAAGAGDDERPARTVQAVAARSLQRADVDIQRDLLPSACRRRRRRRRRH